MRDGDRLGREFDRVERRAVAAVGDVDQHADLVHRLDDCHAEIGDAAVDTLGTAAADEVLRIVGELRTTLSELVEHLHVLRLAEVLGILQAHDDADLALRLGAVQIGRLADEREQVRMATDEALPRREERQRLFDDLRATRADRIVEAGDAARAEHRLFLRSQRPCIRLGAEVDHDHREHVDHERAFDEFHGARRVFRRCSRERLEAAEAQHWQAEIRGRDGQRGLQQASSPNHFPGLVRHRSPPGPVDVSSSRRRPRVRRGMQCGHLRSEPRVRDPAPGSWDRRGPRFHRVARR